MRLLLTILILFLWSCDFKSSEDYHKMANEREGQAKYKEAIILLDKAIEKDPKNIAALMDRGVDKAMVDDFKGAISDYNKVINIDKDNGLAFLNRGKSNMRLGDYNAAINDFNSAIATKGGENFYLDKVENSFVETGYEYDVKMEEIRFERAFAYFEIDSLKKAFSDFNFSIRMNFALPASYYGRGLIYLSYNQKGKGCNDLLKASELGDSNAADIIKAHCK
jgi:tetratricopeptide (TPR) repeat protein